MYVYTRMLQKLADMNEIKAVQRTCAYHYFTYLFISQHHDIFICHECFEGIDTYSIQAKTTVSYNFRAGLSLVSK